MKTKFNLLLTIALALVGVSATAQTKVLTSAYSATTPLTLLSNGTYIVRDIFLISTNTATSTVKFYDSESNKTNQVLAAYTTYASYTTNYSTVWTNAAGLLITNTFSGIYTAPTSVAAVTNQLSAVIGPVLVPATSTRLIENINVSPAQGLTIYSTHNGTVEIVYEER